MRQVKSEIIPLFIGEGVQSIMKRVWLQIFVLACSSVLIFTASAKAQKPLDWSSFPERVRAHRAAFHQKQEQASLASQSVPVKPLSCVSAYESALLRARSLDELLPFFSSHYCQVYMPKQSSECREELAKLVADYVHPMPNAKERKVRANVIRRGEASVILIGSAPYKGQVKGIIVQFRLVPENNYWRIDGYTAQTGLNLFTIPGPQ